jgi:hypothetical protein
MTDDRRAGLIAVFWIVPCAYGLMLIGASTWWLATGEPFDRDTYARIGGSPWPEIVSNLTSAQSRVWAAMVRLLGGNDGLLAGGLTVALGIFGYRSGARWVWFTLWLLPTHALLDLVILVTSGGLSVAAMLWDLGLATAMVVTLVVVYPHFLQEPPAPHGGLSGRQRTRRVRRGRSPFDRA